MGKRIKERKTDFLALWRDFMSGGTAEKTQEEEILTSSEISNEDKKILLKALDDNERLMNKMFKNQYKTSNLKVNHKETAKKVVQEYNKEKSENVKQKQSEGRELLDD